MYQNGELGGQSMARMGQIGALRDQRVVEWAPSGGIGGHSGA